MTAIWAQTQLKWLAIQHEVGHRQADPSVEFVEFPEPGSSQVALLHIFTETLDGNIAPAVAAKQIAEWVLSVPDTDFCYNIDTAYANMLGVLFSASRDLSSRAHLANLADLSIALASQPDAYNTKDSPLVFDYGSVVVPPGEKMRVPCISGGALWSQLPDFAYLIGDALNRGPPNYFPPIPSDRSEDQRHVYRLAEQKYTNINTFAALIAVQHPPTNSPFASCLTCAYIVFAFLEHGPGTPRGKWAHLAVRAAATWLIIAGEELVDPGPPKTVAGYLTGSLWEAEGGKNTVDVKRLRFWKNRFLHFRESGQLVSSEAADAAREAEVVLDGLIGKYDVSISPFW